MAQTQEALFDRGLQRTFDYTPASAVAAGEIVPFGSGLDRFVGVANAAIAASETGSLDFAGIYRVKKKSGEVFSIGEQVGWDEGNNEAVKHDDAGIDFYLGVCLKAAAGGDDYVLTVINQTRGHEGDSSGV